MKKAVRAIIIKDDYILVMRRDKFGQTYYTLIGGRVEMNESPKKALLREIHEESMLHTANPRLVFIEHSPAPYGDQYVYVCDYVSGVPMLHEDSEELAINRGGKNVYTPMWVSIEEFRKLPFRTSNIRDHVLAGIENNFADDVHEFTSEV